MDINEKNIAITALAFLLAACGSGESDPVSRNDSTSDVMGLSDSIGVTVKDVKLVADEFEVAGQPAVSIHIGPNSRKGFNIHLQRSNVRAGYWVESIRSNQPEIAISATWHGLKFVQSAHYPTYANISIRSISPQEAVIDVSAKLVNLTTGNFLTLDRSVIKIQGEYLRVLVAEK